MREPDDDLFPATPVTALHRIRWIWPVYAVLFLVSIPWYHAADAAPRTWLGLPHWVVISLAAVVAIAVFTVFVITRYWREGDVE